MKTITQTALFQAQPGLKTLLSNLVDDLPVENEPDEGIRELINDIARRERSAPTRSAALKAYNDNRVILLLDKSKYARVPSQVPMISIKKRVYVGLFRMTTRTASGGSHVHLKLLLGLLSAGAVYHAMVDNPGMFTRNRKLMLDLMLVYTRVVANVLDKKYDLGRGTAHGDNVRYCLAKFFLLNMSEYKWTPMVDEYAAKASQETDPSTVRLADADEDPNRIYETFESLITFMARKFPRMSRATPRAVMAEMANTHRASGVLMADYLPYLAAQVVLFGTGSGFGNEFVFERAMGRNGIAAFKQLAALA